MSGSLPRDASILITLMGSIGDVARGLSLVSPIKAALPQSRLTWLVEPASRPLVADDPRVDRIVVFDRPRGLRAVRDVFSTLREENYTVALDLQRHFKSGLFTQRSGATRRIGFHRRNAKEGNWLFQTEHICEVPDSVSKLEHYAFFLDRLGITKPQTPEFGYGRRDPREVVPAFLSQIANSFVVFILGSSWGSKDWLLEGYRKLLDAVLGKTDLSVVLCGDRSQIARGGELTTSVANARVVDLTGRTSLLELLYLLKSAEACVGPDSGPAHMAAAVGTPHVTLFGPTSPLRTAPFGFLDLALQAPIGCAPCYRKTCPGLDRMCMRLLSAESVWGRLKMALER